MAENEGSTATAESATSGDTSDGKNWQAEADKWKTLARKHETTAKANAEAAERLAKLEESQKTESEKLAERIAAAEKQASEAALERLRYEVALEKGLTKVQARRLIGTNAEELAADADELLASFNKGPERPKGDATQGPRQSGAPKTDMNAAIKAAFGR